MTPKTQDPTPGAAASRCYYLAGPMRRIPYFNFPAFDSAAAQLRARGHTIVSPAELDRATGFDELQHPTGQLEEVHPPFDLQAARLRDIRAIERADGLCLLPGWQDSIGATAERAYALWAGKEIRTLEGLLSDPPIYIGIDLGRQEISTD